MVTMERKQKIFNSFNVFCSLKSTPNSLQNFKSLRIMVFEIMGGGGGGECIVSIRRGYQTSQYGKG